MKALLSLRAGGPETLQLSELPTPEPGAGELRVATIGSDAMTAQVTSGWGSTREKPRSISPRCSALATAGEKSLETRKSISLSWSRRICVT